jgi:hypothetical protein
MPLYPELWRGCVGAWAPCLGPTGLTLRDNSRFGNHGTLINGPTWNASGGRHALGFDGVNDQITFASPGRCAVSGAQSLSLWFNARSIVVANNPQMFNLGLTASPFTGQCLLGFNIANAGPTIGTSQLCFIDYNASLGGVSGSYTTQSFGGRLNEWIHVVGQWTGTIWRTWINGVEDTNAQGTQDAPTAQPTGVMTIGSIATSRFFDGNIDDVGIYNRALSPNEIRLLATRRGIAYEMAPRRRSRAVVITSGFSALRPSILRGSR